MDEIDNFRAWAYEERNHTSHELGRLMFLNIFSEGNHDEIESIYKNLADVLPNINENALRNKDISNNTSKNIVQSFYYNLSGEKNYFILSGLLKLDDPYPLNTFLLYINVPESNLDKKSLSGSNITWKEVKDTYFGPSGLVSAIQDEAIFHSLFEDNLDNRQTLEWYYNTETLDEDFINNTLFKKYGDQLDTPPREYYEQFFEDLILPLELNVSSSNTLSGEYAKGGDTITLSFTTAGNYSSSKVTLYNAEDIVLGSGQYITTKDDWEYTYILDGSEVSGPFYYTIDLSGDLKQELPSFPLFIEDFYYKKNQGYLFRFNIGDLTQQQYDGSGFNSVYGNLSGFEVIIESDKRFYGKDDGTSYLIDDYFTISEGLNKIELEKEDNSGRKLIIKIIDELSQDHAFEITPSGFINGDLSEDIQFNMTLKTTDESIYRYNMNFIHNNDGSGKDLGTFVNSDLNYTIKRYDPPDDTQFTGYKLHQFYLAGRQGLLDRSIIFIDNTPPTVVITASGLSDGETRNLSGINLEFTLSEDSITFSGDDIISLGGQISNFTGSGKSYEAFYTASGLGSQEITVPGESFTDLAGNLNEHETTFSWTRIGVPTLNSIDISSNNINDPTRYAISGDVISVSFITDIDIGGADVTISDASGITNILNNASADGSGKNWNISGIVSGQEVNGELIYNINLIGLEGFNGNASGISNIFVDNIIPTIIISSEPDIFEKHLNNYLLQDVVFKFSLNKEPKNFNVNKIDGTLFLGINQFSGSGTEFTSKILDFGGIGGLKSISIRENAFTDLAGNGNYLSNVYSWNQDYTSPTLSGLIDISSNNTFFPNTHAISGDKINISFTTNEPLNDISGASIIVKDVSGNPTNISGFMDGSGYNWNFSGFLLGTEITGELQYDITLRDRANNTHIINTGSNFNIDNIKPNLQITSTDNVSGQRSNLSGINLTFKLSEDSITFSGSDIFSLSGTISNFTGSGTEYSAIYTPSGDGLKEIQVKSDSFTDLYGNNNLDSNIFSWTYDSTPANLSGINISSSNSSYLLYAIEGESIILSFETDEDLSSANVTMTDASNNPTTITNIPADGSGKFWTVSGKVLGSETSGEINWHIDMVDSVGNVSSSGGTSALLNIDNILPTANLLEVFDFTDPNLISVKKDDEISFKLTNNSSKDIITQNLKLFDSNNDLLIENTDNNLILEELEYTYPNSLYTITGNEANGKIKYEIEIKDDAGNKNILIGESLIIDLVKPEVIITSEPSFIYDSYTNISGILLKFDISEETNSFSGNNISILNGSGIFTDFSGSSKFYTVIYTPHNEELQKIVVEADKFEDIAGNNNIGSNVIQWTYDKTPPLITIDSVDICGVTKNDDYNFSGGPTINNSINICFTINEPINGFTIGDIEINNALGSLANFYKKNSFLGPDKYQVTYIPNQTGIHEIKVKGGTFTDLAGNSNLETKLTFEKLERGIDISYIVKNIIGDIVNNNDITTDISLEVDIKITDNQYNQTQFDLSYNQLQRVNCVATSSLLTGNSNASGTTYSATFNAISENQCVIKIPADTIFDTRGFGNLESSFNWTHTRDGIELVLDENVMILTDQSGSLISLQSMKQTDSLDLYTIEGTTIEKLLDLREDAWNLHFNDSSIKNSNNTIVKLYYGIKPLVN